MSQYYEVDGEPVWSAGPGTSKVFLGHVRVHEEYLGVPSGVGPMVNDECRIDPAVFEDFVNTLLERYDRTGSAVLGALVEGFIATVLVLAERTGVTVRWPDPSAGYGGRADLRWPAPGEQSWAVRVRALADDLRGSVRP